MEGIRSRERHENYLEIIIRLIFDKSGSAVLRAWDVLR